MTKYKRGGVEITIKNLQSRLPIRPAKIKNLVRKILKGERIKKAGWINICFTDNPSIRRCNAKFLKSDKTTDVLAFDSGSRRLLLADIMISTDKAIEHAHYFKTTPGYELLLYVAHGILHLLGFNDHTATQIRLMRKKESQYVHR